MWVNVLLQVDNIHGCILVPPRWIIEPKNMNAMKGNDVVLNCLAEGFPKPSITWMQAKGMNYFQSFK